MLLYALSIFVSAFLLFQVQPVIAKLILPWFGGSASVGITCLVFFQVALLLGYSYGHWLIDHVRPRWQRRIHVLLLAASILVLPVIPRDAWKPTGWEDPTLRILSVLAATLGLPYLLLSATSPILQAWYARGPEAAEPYRLFAFSNAGSMLGLLSYPVVVEPFVSVRHQAVGWSLEYVALAALLARVAFLPRCDPQGEGQGFDSAESVASPPSRPAPHSDEESGHGGSASRRPEGEASLGVAEAQPFCSGAGRWKIQLLWMALAACASTLLLVITNHMTQNVGCNCRKTRYKHHAYTMFTTHPRRNKMSAIRLHA